MSTESVLIYKLATALRVELDACELANRGKPMSAHHDHVRDLLAEAERYEQEGKT